MPLEGADRLIRLAEVLRVQAWTDQERQRLCAWLQRELGCSAAPAPTGAGGLPYEPVVTLAVTPFQDLLTVEATLVGPQGQTATTAMLLDTGSSTILLNGPLAQTLGLPQLGTSTSEGIDSQPVQTWTSQVAIRLGGVDFGAFPCVVDPTLQIPPLLGISFAEQAGLAVLADPKALRVIYLKPVA